ncbi:MAG: 3-isopropylmalate dehydratase small subunit [Firmicutes bacterium]|nr:3-isopropylmalate dehydratase small subunit [Bacillota bacterium]
MARAWKYGDNVDTDVIIPARYLLTGDPAVLAQHCLENLDPRFVPEHRPGDVIVAGRNFGCGSSREHAPLAIKGAGVACVIAASFARIFFRNAINIGLPVYESPEAAAGIQTGDEVELDEAAGRIRNLTRGESYPFRPLPPFIQEIVRAGGLMARLRAELAAQEAAPAPAAAAADPRQAAADPRPASAADPRQAAGGDGR